MKTVEEVFKGKEGRAVPAVPGAFTPTCNNNHLPGFLANADAFKSKGTSTPSPSPASTTCSCSTPGKKATGAGGKIEFLSDGNGDFAKALDLTLDGLGFGLGTLLQAALRHAGRRRRGEEAECRGRCR